MYTISKYSWAKITIFVVNQIVKKTVCIFKFNMLFAVFLLFLLQNLLAVCGSFCPEAFFPQCLSCIVARNWILRLPLTLCIEFRYLLQTTAYHLVFLSLLQQVSWQPLHFEIAISR